MRPVGLRKGILRGQESLSSRAVSFSFGVFLEGVGDCDGPVAKILAIHGLDGGVGSVEACEIDEGITLGVARVGVSHDLWCLEDYAEGTERVVQQFFVNLWVEITNEDVGAHVQVFVVSRRFVHPNGLPIELDHVHDFNGIISIFFTEELHKAIP